MTFKRTQQRVRRRGRIQKQCCKLFLRFAGKPDYFNLSDGLPGGFLRGGDHEIADRAALNLGSAPDNGLSLGRYARLDASRPAMLLLSHRSCSS